MLILRRRSGDSFIIGDQISVTVLSAEPNGVVTVGITAPKDMLILRSELQQATSANQDAAQPAPLQLITELEQSMSEEDGGHSVPSKTD